MITLLMAMLMLISWVLVTILGFIGIVINSIIKIYRKESLADYYLSIAIGNDQVGGTVIYQTEDWTISSYTYYLHSIGNKNATLAMYFINGLILTFVSVFYFGGKALNWLAGEFNVHYDFTLITDKKWEMQKQHCKNSYIKEHREMSEKLKRMKTNIDN